jgi:A/G-specific adenine glycosylase
MDLGAGICTPRAPACPTCPLHSHCAGRAAGIAERLPQKVVRAARSTRAATAFVALRSDGTVLLRRRPPQGLLGGMLEVPSTPWHAAAPDRGIEPLDLAATAPVRAAWRTLDAPVVHVFTHFRLEMTVARAHVSRRIALRHAADPSRCLWWPLDDLATAALPSLMRKVLRAALDGAR